MKPRANNDPVKYMNIQELSDSRRDENIVHTTIAHLRDCLVRGESKEVRK